MYIFDYGSRNYRSYASLCFVVLVARIFNQQIFGKQSTLLAGGFYGGGGCFV